MKNTRKTYTTDVLVIGGGLGGAVSEVLAEYGKGIKFKRLGLKNFVEGYGKHDEVKAANGLGVSDMVNAARLFLT